MTLSNPKDGLLDDKNIKKNMLLSTVYKPVSMIISLVYVPVFLACLGEEKYGVWVTISSVLSWLTQFDIGIGNGLRNKLTESLSLDDEKKSQSLVSTAYVVLGAISIGVFFVFILFSSLFDLPKFLKLELSSEPVKIVMIIAAASVCLNFLLGLCNNIFYAIQEASKVSLKGIAVQLLQLFSAVFLIVLSKSSLILVALLYGLSEIFVNLGFSFYLYRKKPFLKPHVAFFGRKYVKDIVSLGLQFFILQICALVIYSTDNMIISRYFGASEVTPYSIVHSAFNIIVAVHAALNMPMWSAYTAAVSIKDYSALKNNLVRICIISVLLVICTIIGIPLFKPVAKLWLHKDMVYAYGLILLEAIYTILALISNVFSSLLSGVNYVRKTVYVSIIQAIINIPISIYCAISLGMGILGVKVGSVLSLAVSAIFNPIWCIEWYKKQVNNK